jgi:hypothetical protein
MDASVGVRRLELEGFIRGLHLPRPEQSRQRGKRRCVSRAVPFIA